VVSPQGDRLATVRTVENQRVFAVSSLTDGHVLGLLHVGEAKLRLIAWLDDWHILIQTSVTGVPNNMSGVDSEWVQSQIYDVSTKQSREIPDRSAASGNARLINSTFGRPMIREVGNDTLLYLEVPVPFPGQPSGADIYRFDVTTGTQRKLFSLGNQATDWVIGKDGELVAAVFYADDKAQWWLSLARGGKLQSLVVDKAPYGAPSIAGFSDDGDKFLLSVFRLGQGAWIPFSTTDGKVQTPLGANAAYDRPIRERLTDRIIGGVNEQPERSYHFSDPKMQDKWLQVQKAFPGDRLVLASFSDDFNKLVIRVDGPKDGFNYQLVDMVSMKVVPIGDVYQGVTQSFPTQEISYQSGDGRTVSGYLTLPTVSPAISLPLVVLPHGGPAVADSGDFDWWSQALAAAGYAVLRPNFRGSTTSPEWLQAGMGEWGKKMQSDLSDGVRDLAAKGTIDPARVCIVGASYGGYAALAGVTLDPPGFYRCAVSVAGPGDLKSMLTWVNARAGNKANAAERYWDAFMGVSGPDDPKLKSISPIEHVSGIKAPVLLIHGKDDSVVPVAQSEDFYDAMRSADKNVQIVKLSGEDHWLSRSETRQRMLTATIEFLQKNNPAGTVKP
jgi:dipeptidyl aminopeptidase/acylaminoacyl peptidase